MRSHFTKYQFNYGQADYPYNLRYKWMSQHKTKNKGDQRFNDNTYFIEMLNNPDLQNLQVQQLSPEVCAKIDQARIESKEKVFVRTNNIYGHYIDLTNMTLVSTCNMTKRRLFTLQSLPAGSVIYHPLTQTSMKLQDNPSPLRQIPHTPIERDILIEEFSPQHKLKLSAQYLGSKIQDLGYSQIQQNQQVQETHWMECVGGHNIRFSPLKQSLSDLIERNFLLYNQRLINGVCEFSWQDTRFIFDIKENTLQNSKTLEVRRIRRINLDQVRNLQEYMRQQEEDSYEKQLNQMRQGNPACDQEWQFEYCNVKGIQWHSFDPIVQDKLERKYVKYVKLGQKKYIYNFCVKRGTQSYYVDFQRMIEYNTLNHTERKIRRLVLNESII